MAATGEGWTREGYSSFEQLVNLYTKSYLKIA